VTATSDVPTAPLLLLRAITILGIACSVPAVLVGLFFIASDAQESTDEWHGIGYFFGALLSVGGGLGAVLLAVVLAALFRRPRAGVTAIGVLAGLGMLVTLGCVATMGPTVLILLMPLLLVAGLAGWALVGAH
jgi:hypothetical protein